MNESDAQRMLDHDADNEFLRSLKIAPLGRFDNDPAVHPHLDRAAKLRVEIEEYERFLRQCGRD